MFSFVFDGNLGRDPSFSLRLKLCTMFFNKMSSQFVPIFHLVFPLCSVGSLPPANALEIFLTCLINGLDLHAG